MYLFIGLGNPGEEYARTRHSVGFLAVEMVREQGMDFSGWKMKKRAHAEIAEGKRDGEKIILVKPQTFMNNSGLAVQSLARIHKINPKNIIAIYDELNIDLGNLKLSFGGSAGGHNGVQSIITALGSQDFWRLRIGIGPRQGAMESFVLTKFSRAEEKILTDALKKTADAVNIIATAGPQKAQNTVNAIRE
ncbi:MAG: aminoacyl-tRNA hydrolase [Patescibacteria group bacterium]